VQKAEGLPRSVARKSFICASRESSGSFPESTTRGRDLGVESEGPAHRKKAINRDRRKRQATLWNVQLTYLLMGTTVKKLGAKKSKQSAKTVRGIGHEHKV